MNSESFDSEQQFRLIVEAAPNGMLLVDERGTMVMVNTSVLRQFGYKREELLGKSVEMLIPGPSRSDHRQHRAGFIKAPETRSMGGGRELSGLRKDGSEFPVEIGLTPIQTTKGMGVVASIWIFQSANVWRCNSDGLSGWQNWAHWLPVWRMKSVRR